jgi:hypothetical protein
MYLHRKMQKCLRRKRKRRRKRRPGKRFRR